MLEKELPGTAGVSPALSGGKKDAGGTPAVPGSYTNRTSTARTPSPSAPIISGLISTSLSDSR